MGGINESLSKGRAFKLEMEMGRVKVPARARARASAVDSSDLSPLSGCGAAKTANCRDLVFCSGEDGWVDSTTQCHSQGTRGSIAQPMERARA